MDEILAIGFQIGIGLLVGAYVSAFAHELGHALMGWWMGYEVTSFGLGIARPILVFGWGDTRVYFCLRQSADGLTFVLPRGQVTTVQQVAFLSGGILANIILSLIGVGLWYSLAWVPAFWLTIAGCNLLFVVGALVPHQHLLASDGRQILQVLRGRPEPGSVVEPLHRMHRFRELWHSVGDRRMEAHCLQGAAGVWGMLGDSAHAHGLVREAEALGAPHLSILDAVAILEQGEADHKAGRLDAAAEAYEKARRLFAAQVARHGEICAIMNLAQLAEEMGRRDEAERLLSEIEKQPWMGDCADLRETWLRSRLKVLGKSLPVDELKQIRTEYESLRAKLTREVSDWHFYAKLRCVHIAREEWSAAEEPCALACKATATLWQALPSAEDRKRFANVAAEFQQQTCDLLKRLGKDDAATTVAALFQEKTEATPEKRAAEEARRLRESKLYRWGIIATGVNAASMGAAIWCSLTIGGFSKAPVALAFLAVLLGIFLGGALMYQALYFFIRACGTHHKETPGTMTLGLAFMPWVIFVAVVLFVALTY
jgi:hypothetical protein